MQSHASIYANGDADDATKEGSGAASLRDALLWKTQSYINGEWVFSSARESFKVSDPSNGQVLGQVTDCGAEDTTIAIQAAHKAYLLWCKLTGHERSSYLSKLATLMTESAYACTTLVSVNIAHDHNFDLPTSLREDLATIITLENGKSLAESRGEIAGSIQQVLWFAGEAQRIYGDFIPSPLKGVRNVVVKQGVGVAALIVPWNFPALMLIRKAAAALAAGATIVAKTPSETPFSSLAFAELCNRAGFPKGVVNVISTSQSSEVGREMCSDPLVRKISFTGSTGVGRLLAAQSASSLKKCSFELGGNAPFIVFDDADLSEAVRSAVAVKFRCSGQVCVASNRILVQSGIYDRFCKLFIEHVRKFKVGAGIQPETTHGPLINAKAVAKVKNHVEDAIRHGAQLLEGGHILEGNFFAPTVLSGGATSMQVHVDETFGPLALLFKFDTEEEALTLANDTEFGLAGYFWSKSLARAWRVAEALNVGMVGINGASVAQACVPFGGVNQSGYGREGSKYGIDEYQEIKLIAMGI